MDPVSSPRVPNVEPSFDSSRHRVRLPRFIVSGPIGLGDAVERMTAAVGVRPCSGCHQRAEQMNKWLILGSETVRTVGNE